MNLLRFAACASIIGLTAGCASGAASSCDGWRAIRPAPADVEVISDSLVASILAHNEHGRTVCGWKAGKD